jgi:hypothetical protein
MKTHLPFNITSANPKKILREKVRGTRSVEGNNGKIVLDMAQEAYRVVVCLYRKNSCCGPHEKPIIPSSSSIRPRCLSPRHHDYSILSIPRQSSVESRAPAASGPRVWLLSPANPLASPSPLAVAAAADQQPSIAALPGPRAASTRPFPIPTPPAANSTRGPDPPPQIRCRSSRPIRAPHARIGLPYAVPRALRLPPVLSGGRRRGRCRKLASAAPSVVVTGFGLRPLLIPVGGLR